MRSGGFKKIDGGSPTGYGNDDDGLAESSIIL